MQARIYGCAMLVLVAACSKDEPSATTPEVKSAVHSATVSAPPPPPVKKGPPRIELNAESLSVGGELLGGRDEWTKKLPVVLGGERLAGEAVTLEVDRKAKPSAVRQLVEGVRTQKPKSVTIQTTHRSGNLSKVEVHLTAAEPEACAATAFIGKDASIAVWTAGGATAQKFNKGLGGPDMTMGGGALTKVRSLCPQGRVVLGADDAMIWGLVVDLFVASAPAGAKDVSEVMLVEGLVPGRKVKLVN